VNAGQQPPPTHRPFAPLTSGQGRPSFAAIATQLPLSLQASARHGVPGGTQDLPLGEGVKLQPVAGTQASSVHGRLSLQIIAAPATQMPSRQTSPVVQALPSLHMAPLGRTGVVQRPLAGSQAPGMWHWLMAGHVTGADRPHTPLVHISTPLQALLSLLHMLPPQQGWFWPPQAQVPWVQARFAPQASPVVQQG
jgi:hypothetical protein